MKEKRKHVNRQPDDEVQFNYDPPMDFPRVMLYTGQGLLSDGTPLVNSASTVDSAVADAFARYQYFCFRPNSLCDTYEFALEELRDRNPNIQFWMQLVTDDVDVTVTSAYQTEFVSIVGDKIWPDALNSGKRHPMLTDDTLRAELVEFWARHLTNGWYSGALIDILGGFPAEEEGNEIDWAASGFESDVAFQLAHQAAANDMIEQLRLRLPNTILIGNYGPGVTSTIYPNRTMIQGWCRENFPNQNPGNWSNNVTAATWGMIHDDSKYGHPTSGMILSPITNHTLSVANEKLLRFHLGSACLGWHILGWGPTNFVCAIPGWSGLSAPDNEGNGCDTLAEHWGIWGYIKEFGINRTTGAETGVSNGWLGQPIGEPTQITANPLPLWFREFVYGTVIVNPNVSGTQTFTLPGSPTRYELLTHATTTWPRSAPTSDTVFLLK